MTKPIISRNTLTMSSRDIAKIASKIGCADVRSEIGRKSASNKKRHADVLRDLAEYVGRWPRL